MEAVIEVKGLSKHFGNIRAVQNLSFVVNQGDVYGFLGQNGAGKSTTMRMLLTLVQPSAGSIQIFGKSLHLARNEILSKTGAMIEQPDLYSYLSGLENLSIFSRLSGLRHSRKQLMEQLDRVGLSARAGSKIKTYSQGMKQRLGIAVALVHDPALILLDEPTNGLDPQGIAEIRDLIRTLSSDHQKTILISSHLLAEVEQVANRMLIIDKGEKIIEGPVRELTRAEQVILEIETIDNAAARELIKTSGWSEFLLDAREEIIRMQLPASRTPELTSQLVAWGAGILSIRRQNLLEAYFLSIISGK